MFLQPKCANIRFSSIIVAIDRLPSKCSCGAYSTFFYKNIFMPWVIFLTSSDACWTPPVFLASGYPLKFWLCLSRANGAHSVHKWPQVCFVQDTGGGLGDGNMDFFFPGKRWHLGFYPDSLRWSTPAWYLEFAEKIQATLKSAGCHCDRWVSMWPQCHVFYASSVSVESLSLCQSYPNGCLSPDLERLCEASWSSQAHSPRL